MRAIPIDGYRAAGCEIVAENTWPDAPADAIIFGLKELPDDGTPLIHRHIMFGHAFKGQHSGRALLARFKAGGGTLYDLEYLVDEDRPPRRRLWLLGRVRRCRRIGEGLGGAGGGRHLPRRRHLPRQDRADRGVARRSCRHRPAPAPRHRHRRARPGRHRCRRSLRRARHATSPAGTWRKPPSGGPFPEILEHEIFLNCIFARPGTPVFVGPDALAQPRRLTVIGDIACDPDSDYNPVPVYNAATSWDAPAVRVAEDPAARRDGDRQPALAPAGRKLRGLRRPALAVAAHARQAGRRRLGPGQSHIRHTT